MSAPYTIVDITPDTPEWLEERRSSLGASEVPAVLGLSPYQTPRGVYLSKLGIDDDFDPERAFVGHAAEVLIEGWIRRFRTELGEVGPAVMVRSVECPWLHASLDRTLTLDGVTVPVQMKSAHYFGVKDWEDGTPLLVQAQVQPEMFCFGAPYAYAAVFGGDMRVRLYRVERDEAWIREHLIPRTRSFWHDNVLARVEPEPVNLAEVAEVYPSAPGSTVEATDDVFDAWIRRESLRIQKTEAEAQMKDLDLRIARHMGDAEALTWDGKPVATYKTQAGRRTVSIADVEALVPDRAADLIRQGNPFKVFRPATTRKKKTDA